MKVIIGSKNPAKYMAVQRTISEMDMENWETVAMDAESGVSKQPLSDQETIDGALHRARQALEKCDEAEFAIGLEGGVVLDSDPAFTVMVCNWGALVAKGGEEFIAGGARIPLPESFKGELMAGRELGDLMDEYCQRKDIRKHEGAVGIFSEGAVTRQQMFEHVSRLLVGQWKYNRKKQA